MQDDSRGKLHPLNEIQYGIYLECKNNPENLMYNIVHLAKIGQGVSVEKVRKSLEAALNFYPALNTALYEDNGRVYMKELDEPFVIPVIRLSNSKFEMIRKDLAKPFSLSGERLIRVRIYETPSGSYVFLEKHHVILDGSTDAIISRAAGKIYAGEEPAAEEVAYFDVAEREKAFLASDDRKTAEEYWKGLLSDTEGEAFPEGDKEDDIPSQGLLHAVFSLDEAEFKGFLKSTGCRKSSFFTGVGAYLMSLYSGNKKTVTESIWHGRDDSLKNTAGMMVRSIPFVCDREAAVSVPEYLKQMEAQLVAGRKYSDLPFIRVAEKYGLKNKVSVAYQGTYSQCLVIEGVDLDVERIYPPSAINSSELIFEISELGGGRYDLQLLYRGDHYSDEFAKSIADTYIHLAKEMIKAESFDDISLLSEDEKARLDAVNYNEKEVEKTDIVTLFNRACNDYPGNGAVVYGENRYTYREVKDIADRIAGYTVKLGLGKEDVVSILIPRNEYIAIAPLGVLEAGCAYQPLDSAYPTERLEYMISDAAAKLLITTRGLISKVPSYKGEVLYLEDIADLPECSDELAPPDPPDLFVLLYTSGTTGKPKGVMLTHANLVNFISWVWDLYELDSASKVSAYASFGFDANMMDLFPALTRGGEVHIISEEMRLSMPDLMEYFDREGITSSVMTTQVARQFATSFKGTKLKYLMGGGEKLVPIQPPKNFTMVNGYGPSECTVATTYKVVDRLYGRIPIGMPVYNAGIYVIDEKGRRLPSGMPGELVISGAGVGRGYLNLPEKTASVFTPNPYSDKAGHETIYHSGDIVRMLPSGDADFLGRNDGQVKIRGFRIETTEVEAVIRDFAGIKDATVQAFDYENAGGKYIAAYIVADETVDIQALKDYIKSRKPSYMVPAVIMQIDAIPLTRNQKVDKRALPAPQISSEAFRAPENDVQKRIFKCAADAIGHDSFGIDTDLYEAGLSSISLMRLIVLLGDEFAVSMRLKDVTDATVTGIEKVILGRIEKTEGKPASKTYPISKTQEGILTECLSNPGTTIYNIPTLLKIGKDIDTVRLKKAVTAAFDAHPYLKLRLKAADDGGFLVSRNDEEKVAISEINAADPEKNITSFVKPFDITKDPLYRACIIKADEVYLFLDLHHIIADGASLSVLLSDIAAAYNGETVSAESFTGFDVAAEEAQRRKSDEFDEAKKYWADLLEGAETDHLPLPDKNDDAPSKGRSKRFLNIYEDAVLALCKKEKISENVFFNAVFAYMLGTLNGRSDALYTTIYSGRDDSRLTRCVDMLVKTLPVYVKWDKDTTVSDYLKAIRTQLFGSMGNDIVSFAELSREYGVSPEMNFAWQPDLFEPLIFEGSEAELLTSDTDTAKFSLYIAASKEKGRYFLDSEYRADLYSAEIIDCFLGLMETVAAEFLKCGKLSETNVLSAEALSAEDGFNATESYVPDTDIVTMFKNAAAKYPDNIAVVYKDKRLTYAEVDDITDRIACAAKRAGLGRGDVVSVLINRCEIMVTASLGAMKAGCAYQPLDPGYPPERLNYMIADSHAKLLVTNKELESHVFGFTGKVLYAEDIDSLPAADLELEHPLGDDLFTLLYTSGTTGKPKGVMLTHSNLVNFCYWYHNEYGMDENCRTAAYASYGFDANMMDMYTPITIGAQLHIIPEDMRLSLLDLKEYFETEGITHSFITTQVGRQFEEIYEKGALRYLLVGGERLVPIAPNEGHKFINIYGPTECTICVTTHHVDRLYHRVPIGKGNYNVKFYILDALGRRLPPGAMGELCISGRCVGKGYLNMPEKTAEVFANNPFTDKAGYEKMYRTGDIVRLLPNGLVDYIGRRDGQVKIRGFRIELSEVEEVIRSFEGIEDATVQAFDAPGGGKYIAAYLVSSSKIDQEALKNYIASKKPPYMVPGAMMQIDRIPLNRNQKVNKRELPVIAPDETDSYVEPETELEKELCEIYAKILELDRVGACDDFFRIGGSSIIAAKLLMQLMKRGYEVVYKDIFSNPSPRQLAKVIKGSADTEDKQGDADAYDYRRIKKVLSPNSMDNIGGMKFNELGDMILTGATGFLGIHVLKAFLDGYTGRVCCLMRKGEYASVEKRLSSMLSYYFGDPMLDLFGKRIFCAEGDITMPESLYQSCLEGYGTVINCAACVKHFTEGDLLERVNHIGVNNLIEMCLKTKKRLVQTSTYSVAGEMEVKEGNVPAISENMLYFGQSVENEYVRTKFLAEREVLEAKAERGLDACIVRMGNLMNRVSDGEFQINLLTNGFMRSLRAYKKLKAFPLSLLDRRAEFSPIDTSAEAVLKFASADKAYSVFHAYNDHTVTFADVIYAMKAYGFEIDIISDEEFNKRANDEIKSAGADETMLGLLAYNNRRGENLVMLGAENRFSVNALYRCGFKWPIIDDAYLKASMEALDSLLFFE